MKKIIASIAASALAGSAAFAGVSATANGSNLYEIILNYDPKYWYSSCFLAMECDYLQKAVNRVN